MIQSDRCTVSSISIWKSATLPACIVRPPYSFGTGISPWLVFSKVWKIVRKTKLAFKQSSGLRLGQPIPKIAKIPKNLVAISDTFWIIKPKSIDEDLSLRAEWADGSVTVDL